MRNTRQEKVITLRKLFEDPAEIVVMPCCYDGLSAKMIENANFKLTFMTGFGVSAVHGYPDTQLISYEEMVAAGRTICQALVNIPCFGDADTGYGNAMNVKRTVQGYIQAGMAGIMIEDQVAPKRCGHTRGKRVESREIAFQRIKAAVDARTESGEDIVILARTDARGTHGMEEAIFRCQEFVRLGADITFLEAPENEDEMVQYCTQVPRIKMANMLENGKTPILAADKLHKIGFQLAAYPLTMLAASIQAMENALASFGNRTTPALAPFSKVKSVVGFDDYYVEEERYKE